MRFVTEQISSEDESTIARLLEAHARPGMVVVELGTYTGRSALAMLPTIARVDGHLTCVDWFQGNRAVEAEIGPSYRAHDILSILRENLAESGHAARVTVLVEETVPAARAFEDRSVDVLFVDADHRYSAVKADLAAWLPKMKPDGLVFGHDFERYLRECDTFSVLAHCEEDFVHGCHYGVIRAVSEIFPDVTRHGRVWSAVAGAHRPAALGAPLGLSTAIPGAARLNGPG